MKSLYNSTNAPPESDLLAMRVYTSRLLGSNPDLVLHGGGNTSVKATAEDLFGEPVELLYVKGSGWDLATIEAPGFAPVRLDVLCRMAELDRLSDRDMVKNQRAAMIDPGAPNPSVEAILHAIIPFRYVDHTHADAVVTLTNTPGGEELVRELYGPRMMIVPYVMPGFILAKTIWEMTHESHWSEVEGMILMSHGVFTWSDDARESYEAMIEIATRAEGVLEKRASLAVGRSETALPDLNALAGIRRQVSAMAGRAMLVETDRSEASVGFSNLENAGDLATRGPLTPDHVIRTKRIAAILKDTEAGLRTFAEEQDRYFNEHNDGSLRQLDRAPRWAVWPGHGTLAFGRTVRDTGIITDIKRHTLRAVRRGEALGGWQALPEKDIFEVEYWELEQAKLEKAGEPPELTGKIALVTGAASGIGRATTEALIEQGAVVAAIDISSDVSGLWSEHTESGQVLAIEADVTDQGQLENSVRATVERYGGLDILVLNAGAFPRSGTIDQIAEDDWQRSLDLNLTSQQNLMRLAIPFLREGIDPTIIVVASKNVTAPGPGAAAYSVAKAGVTQLARIAALELAGSGVRVNQVHPDAVFDTGVWTNEVLEERAEHYGMTVEQYKRKNLLQVEVTSRDVAALVCALAGPLFAKTTGAQIPVDGGNDRVV